VVDGATLQNDKRFITSPDKLLTIGCNTRILWNSPHPSESLWNSDGISVAWANLPSSPQPAK
jgi:hypothetical protein